MLWPRRALYHDRLMVLSRRPLLGGVLGALVTTGQRAWAAPPIALTLAYERYRLPNGLEVILHEDARTPVAAVNLWYHVGSKDEPQGKSGFAHLFEHLMFEGSRHVGEGMFLRYLDRIGAVDRNGTTNTDRTSYYETVPRGRLELALWLESDRMAFLLDRVDQASLDRQREVVKNERRERYENVPYGLVPQFVRAALFPADHPYHRLAIGTPEDLDRASLDDVKSFFRTFYGPNNATLVVAGAITPDLVKPLVSRYFGPIVAPVTPPARVTPTVPTLTAEKRLALEADVELPRLYLSWPTVPLFAPGDAELDAAAKILSAGPGSRLQRRLIHDLGVAQHVGVQQASSQLAGVFEIVVTLRRGQDIAAVLGHVDTALDALRTQGPTEAEVQRAQARATTNLVLAAERTSGRANALNLYNQFAGEPDYLATDLGRYRALTPAAVQRAVAAQLPAMGRLVTVVTPNPRAPRASALRGKP